MRKLLLLLLLCFLAKVAMGQDQPVFTDIEEIGKRWAASQPPPVSLAKFSTSLRVYDALALADCATTLVGLSQGHREGNVILNTGNSVSTGIVTVGLAVLGHYGLELLYKNGYTKTALWMARVSSVVRLGAATNNVWVTKKGRVEP